LKGVIITNKNQWGFVLNPIAGNGYAGDILEKVKQIIQDRNLNAEVVLSERKYHATEIAREFLNKGYDHIVAIGGDGTINETAQALVNVPDVKFGAVSAGTGNDFIQILGFSDHFTENDWRIFFEENTIKMDVGVCNGHYFFNGLGIGFDAEVAAQNYAEEGVVKKGGKNKYLWHIIKTLLMYNEKTMLTTSNGSITETKCFINTVSNGRRFAAKYFLTPKAIANDGLLDVCSIKELRLFQRFGIFLQVPTGAHLENPHVNYYTTDKIHIVFPSKMPYHLDGEIFYDSTFDVTILPSNVNIIYNPYGNHYFMK